MTDTKLIASLFARLNQNQLALGAMVEEFSNWVEQRGSADIANNVRGALETLDENLEVPYRRDEVAPPVICLVSPSIVLEAQGAKQMWAGGEGFPYDTGRFLVTSLDLPANSEVTLGSPEQPCLGLSATSWPCGSGR